MQTEIQKLSDRELDAAILMEVWGWSEDEARKGISRTGMFRVEYTDPAESFRLLEWLTKREDVLLMQRDCAGWSIEWARMEMFIADDCPTLQRAVAEAALMVARQEANP